MFFDDFFCIYQFKIIAFVTLILILFIIPFVPAPKRCEVHVDRWTCGHVGMWTCGHVGMWRCGRVGMCRLRSDARYMGGGELGELGELGGLGELGQLGQLGGFRV